MGVVKRALADGVAPAEVREFIADVVNVCWAADWADLYALLEAASGLSVAQIGTALGVSQYHTLRSWRKGERTPQERRFRHYAARLSTLSGVAVQILYEARSRTIAKRAGGLVPRPGWAIEYSPTGLEVPYYLRRLRDAASLTVEEVARQVGAAPADYERWEGGQRTPRPGKLGVLWRVMGRPQGVLLCEMQAARDRGAAATYNERRRKAQIGLDRIAYYAFETGYSRREAAREIKALDEFEYDYHRYDYQHQCLKPEYVRRMRRRMGFDRTRRSNQPE